MRASHPTFEDSLKGVRAVRIAEDLKLNRALHSRVLKSFYKMYAPRNQQPLSPPQRNKPLPSDAPTQTASRHPAESPPDVGSIKKLLATQINQNSPWSDIRKTATELLKLRPTEETASWYTELCFLHSGVEEASNAVRHYLSWHTAEFYFQIHPKIREKIALYILDKGWLRVLGHTIFNSKHQNWLRPIERKIYFLWLAQEKKDSLAFMFYQKYHADIDQPFPTESQKYNPGSSGIRLRAARIALKLGRTEEGVLLCKKIPPSHPEYKEALSLLHQSGPDRDFFKDSDLRQKFLETDSSSERLKILKEFMLQVKLKGQDLTGEWLTLNAFLSELGEWIDSKPQTLEHLSFLFIEMKALALILPNYWNLFFEASVRMDSTAEDCARWRPFVLMEQHDSTALRYLRGAAILHLTLQGEIQKNTDSQIFLARDLIISTESKRLNEHLTHLPRWETIWTMYLQFVTRQGNFAPAKRTFLINLLKAAKSAKNMILQDVEDYLKSPQSRPPGYILAHFQKEAREQQALEWELLTYLKLPSCYSHFTNQDLKRIWYICAQRNLSDLGWRCLSILACRTQLPVHLDKHLLVSGERRENYQWCQPGAKEFDSCFIGLSSEQSKFVWACLKVGGKLPSLLSQISNKVQLGKSLSIRKALEKSDQSAKVLNKIKWLKESTDFRTNYSGDAEFNKVPAFSELLPNTPWSHLVSEIAARMAVSSWRWRTQELKSQLQEIRTSPKESWKMMETNPINPLTKWMKTLNHEQRNAWHDLSQLCHRLDNEQGFYALAVFICRLALVIYPDHYGAIQALHEMRAPVFIIWELEKWILSPQYSQIRSINHTAHQADIPNSLRQNPIYS